MRRLVDRDQPAPRDVIADGVRGVGHGEVTGVGEGIQPEARWFARTPDGGCRQKLARPAARGADEGTGARSSSVGRSGNVPEKQEHDRCKSAVIGSTRR